MPSFNPQNSCVAENLIETKDDMITDFMANLKGPSTKKREEKSAKVNGIKISLNKIHASDGTSENMSTDIDLSPKCNRFKLVSRPKIGFYTQEQRNHKILAYKLKIQKWIKGEHKNKDLYCKRRAIAKQKTRVGGKFVKNSDELQSNYNSN